MGKLSKSLRGQHQPANTPSSQVSSHQVPTQSAHTLPGLPVELIYQIASLMTPREAIGFASASRRLHDLVEKETWRHVQVVVSSHQPQSKPFSSSKPTLAERIHKGWKELERAITAREERAKYVQSLTYPMSVEAGPTASKVLKLLVNLRMVTDYNAFNDINRSTTDLPCPSDRWRSYNLLRHAGRRDTICALHLPFAQGHQDHLFPVLQNFPGLIQLEASACEFVPQSTRIELPPPKLPALKSLKLCAANGLATCIQLLKESPKLDELVLKDISIAWGYERATSRPPGLDKLLQSRQIRLLNLEDYMWSFLTDKGSSSNNYVPNLEVLTLKGSVSVWGSQRPLCLLMCRYSLNAYRNIQISSGSI